MGEVVIVDGCRSPIIKRNSSFKNLRPDELLAYVLQDLITRVNIDKELVDDIIVGCVTQVGEQAMNIARTAALIADFPTTVPGVTIDRQCGSSQQAVHFASQAILAGDMDVVIAGGVESMSRSPMFSNVGDVKLSEKLINKYNIVNQGISAELIAEKWGFSREQLDNYALSSHKRAIEAIERGKFNEEITPIELEGDVISIDDGPRYNTSLEALSRLKPVFKQNGMITAGNASQMSDGASALLLMSAKKASELNLKPKAKIVARSVVGSDPTLMLTGPIEATRDVLQKASLSIKDIDRYEINEAFAPVPLAWLHDIKADREKLNVNGGAIALGHPLGATGAKLLVSLMYELERIEGTYGLLSICEGMGMANATVIKRI